MSESIRYSRGEHKFDNKPAQITAQSFKDFEVSVLEDVSERKGMAFICSPLSSGPHYQKPEKYQGTATWRLKDYVAPRRFIAFDFDGFVDRPTFERTLAFLQNFRGFGYTTASSSPDKPRARAILATNCELNRNDCIAASLALQALMDHHVGMDKIEFDQSVYRGEQPRKQPIICLESLSNTRR